MWECEYKMYTILKPPTKNVKWSAGQQRQRCSMGESSTESELENTTL